MFICMPSWFEMVISVGGTNVDILHQSLKMVPGAFCRHHPLVQHGRRISRQIYGASLQSTAFQLSDQIMLKVTDLSRLPSRKQQK